MLKLGLIGEGIAQSQSPDLHQRLGRKVSIDLSYELFDAINKPDFSFEQQVETLRAQGYAGVNVTYPFKGRAIDVADTLGDGPRLVGSSNTLLFTENGIHAENTDYSGFMTAFRQNFGDRKPGRVLLIGAGGVGRAVACGLNQLGCEHLHIIEFDDARAKHLSTTLSEQGLSNDIITSDQLASLVPGLDGVVNCSPVGHINHPGCPIDASLIQPHQWLFDAVYVPAMTELLQAAKKIGAPYITGVGLFVYQGLDAFHWFIKQTNPDVSAYPFADEIRQHYVDLLTKS